MILYAVCLRLPASGYRVASKRVHMPGDWLKVRRIHAASVAAQVIQLESSGDRATKALVVDAMRVLHPPALAQMTIPAASDGTLPNPAAGGFINDIIDGGQPSGSLVVAVDVANWLAFDMPILCGCLPSDRSWITTPAMTLTPWGLALERSTHRAPPSNWRTH